MPKALCIAGMVVALLVGLLFLLDLVLGIPFSKASIVMDIALVVSAVILGAISWLTFREQA